MPAFPEEGPPMALINDASMVNVGGAVLDGHATGRGQCSSGGQV